jgi:protein arginine N-methyltransferase 1
MSTVAELSRNEEEQKKFEGSSDFANYFCSYAFLYHQKEMLEDKRRMDAYYNGIMRNKHHFEGKVVLDVGAGSGILSIWAAKAGARKVYGVEATRMSRHARNLVKAQGLEDTVEIIQREVEELVLPEKVDVIISEWMGYLLLRESMLDSVLVAKEKWLKPDGVLYPSHAWIHVAPIFTKECAQVAGQCEDSLADWKHFSEQTRQSYGVDMSCLHEDFEKEQRAYYLRTCVWANLDYSHVRGETATVSELDLNNLSVEDFKTIRSKFSSRITKEGEITGFTGWFSVEFRGSDINPATQPYVALDTAPGKGWTHWGQQVMYVHPPVKVARDDVLEGEIEISRMKDNQRLLDVELEFQRKQKGEAAEGAFKAKYQLQ